MLLKFSHKNTKGIVLIAVVMIIVIAAIAIYGVTTFALQRSRYSQARIDTISANYVAQAGIQWAIYWYRFRDIAGNGYYSLGPQTVDGNTFTLSASPAELLMINTSTSALNGNGTRVQSFQLQNATNSNTITIDRMIVTWSNAARLREIRLNNQRLWTGNVLSGVNADLLPNFVLNATPTLYTGATNRLVFSVDMTGARVTVQFLMSDGTSRTTQLYPATNYFKFTINSKGQKTGGSIYKTIRAEYNAYNPNPLANPPNQTKINDYDGIN